MSKWRLAILALLLVIAVGVGLLLGWSFTLLLRWRTPPGIVNTATILRQVQTLSQLVTVKYLLEKVIILEDVKWYGENRVLLVAHGVVKAGVDLQQIKAADVSIDKKRIVITLPPATLTDVYLDDHQTRVVEHTTGLLRNYDKDLEQNARRMALDDLKRAATRGGILDDATERARLQVKQLFLQQGFEEVVVKSP